MGQTKDFGDTIVNWTPPSRPDGVVLDGQYCRLEPLQAQTHAALLFRAYEGHDAVWDYLGYGPFHSAAQYHRWVREVEGQSDPVFFAIYDKDRRAFGGVASLLRIKPEAGVIEVGHINLSPSLQRSRAATEAMFLFQDWAFRAGYRRFEWKCDSLNYPSRRSAQRLGFSYEGVFRQHLIVKGRNRDTAWFATIDKEWDAMRAAYEAWLNPTNFDDTDKQRESLSDLTRLVRAQDDPSL